MERPLLKSLADNPNLLKELRSLLEEQFMVEENRSDDQVSDERLGQMFRARLVGLQKLEIAFKEIAKYKSRLELPENKINRAR